MDGRTPASLQRRPNWMDVYWPPWSAGARTRSCRPSVRSWATAIRIRRPVSCGEVLGFGQTSSVSRIFVIVVAPPGHAVVCGAALDLVPGHLHREVFAAVVRSIKVEKK